MNNLIEKAKTSYEELSLISGLLNIYINSLDNDDITKTDSLSLLYTIDDKIKLLKENLAVFAE